MDPNPPAGEMKQPHEEFVPVQVVEAGQPITTEQISKVREALKLKSWVVAMYVVSAIQVVMGLLGLLSEDLNGFINIGLATAGFLGARKLNMPLTIVLLSFACLIVAVLILLLIVAYELWILWLFIIALYLPAIIIPSGFLNLLRKFTEEERRQMLSATSGSYNIFH